MRSCPPLVPSSGRHHVPPTPHPPAPGNSTPSALLDLSCLLAVCASRPPVSFCLIRGNEKGTRWARPSRPHYRRDVTWAKMPSRALATSAWTRPSMQIAAACAPPNAAHTRGCFGDWLSAGATRGWSGRSGKAPEPACRPSSPRCASHKLGNHLEAAMGVTAAK